MILPTEKTQPKKRLEDYSILLYGQPKIGKSTFCSQMGNPLFIDTESGLNALSVFKVDVLDWKSFLEVYQTIVKEKPPYQTIVIDNVDNLWKICSEYIKKRYNIYHESELRFGKGWQMVKDEFFGALRSLSLLPYGLVMISHVKRVEIQTKVSTFTKAVPSLARAGQEMVMGMVDLILYAEIIRTNQGEKRILRTQPSENWEAGDRTEHAFGRKLPLALPFHFPSFQQAFYNLKTEERK